MIDAVVLRLVRHLQEAGFPYMIVGSIGSMFYSEPRATLDVDVVVDAKPEQAAQLIAAFPADAWFIPPLEVVAHELRRGSQGMFNLIDEVTAAKAALYPAGNDQLIRWGLAHVQQHTMADRQVPVAPPEYLIVMKLRYHAISGQEKHLRDIQALLRIAGASIDSTEVQRWAVHYGVEAAWERVR